MSYTFISGDGSILTADSSIVSGVIQRPIINIGSVLGAIPTTFSGSPSISGAVTIVGTPSISGTVNIGTIPGSVVAFQGTTPWVVSSVYGNISGSVVAFQGTSPWAIGSVYGNISGSVAAHQAGTWVTSLISATPSSVLVGASIFGQLPAGTAVLGSIVALQGTSPWNIAGSVAATVTNTNINVSGSVVAFISGVPQASVHGAVSVTNFPTTQNVSGSVAAFVQGTPGIAITSIATANGGLPIFAPLTARLQGTADLRVVQGASVVVIAAQGSGVRTYIDHVQVANFGSASVLVTIADTTTSILGYTIAPAGGGSNFDCFFRGSANNPITASINGTASVLVSMQGFTSAT